MLRLSRTRAAARPSFSRLPKIKTLAPIPALVSVAHEVDALADKSRRASRHCALAPPTKHANLTAEAQELRARELLRQHEPVVLDEIERKKKIAAYGLCINETTTNAITQKSTAVTKNAVSEAQAAL